MHAVAVLLTWTHAWHKGVEHTLGKATQVGVAVTSLAVEQAQFNALGFWCPDCEVHTAVDKGGAQGLGSPQMIHTHLRRERHPIVSYRCWLVWGRA